MEGACARLQGFSGAENVPGNAAAGPLHHQEQQPWCQPRLTVRVTDTPTATAAAPPPVSCPSRLQLSPARRGSAAFDPFAPPPTEDRPPGCTPVCTHAPEAPPAVHRKASAGSPVPPAQPAVLFPADRVQSCPPERLGRRGTRPLVRIRVKRSLSGAVAAAAGSIGALARRPMDTSMPAAPPPPQLAGCSRKRFEAELLSPPLPRKSSRTLLDDQHAADLLARLHLAPPPAAAGACGDASSGSSAVPVEASLLHWAAAAPARLASNARPT